MHEIQCPHCGKMFQVEESGYAAIVKQVRDKEFKKELEERQNLYKEEKDSAVKLAVAQLEAEKEREILQLKADVESGKTEKQLAVDTVAAEKDKLLAEKDLEIARLKSEVDLSKANTDLAVKNAVQERDTTIVELQSQMKLKDNEWELKEKSLCEKHADELKRCEEEVAFYKDFKAKQSTKMIGESLEQHCEIEFNKLRATAFPRAYFEKDNDARTGSKGDFIYREYSEDGTEFISIMFEMKNGATCCCMKSAA